MDPEGSAGSEGSEIAGDRVRKLRALLTYSLVRADDHIGHVNRLLSSTSSLDTTLLTTTNTFHLLHALLHRIISYNLSRSAEKLVQTISSQDGTSFLSLKLLGSLLTAPSSRLVRFNTSLAKLTTHLDELRMSLRLWGLLRIWSWGSSVYKSPPEDVILRAVAWAQVAACAAYQALENAAFLSSKGVVALPSGREGHAWLWSSRFWALHVALEFVRLARTRTLKDEERSLVVTEGPGEKEVQLAKEEERNEWTKQLTVNAAWAPLTLHWSLPNGFADEAQIAVLSLIAGVIGLKAAWRATA